MTPALRTTNLIIYYVFSLFPFGDICKIVDSVTYIPIARQRVGKHIPTTHKHTTIGRNLVGNGAVNKLRQ
jgi:hypothetical protein